MTTMTCLMTTMTCLMAQMTCLMAQRHCVRDELQQLPVQDGPGNLVALGDLDGEGDSPVLRTTRYESRVVVGVSRASLA